MHKKILIVVDMQNDFITGPLGGEAAQKSIKSVVKKINKYNNDTDSVFYTLDTHSEDYLETLEGKKLPIPHCIINTEGHQLCPEVKEALSKCRDVTGVHKSTFGSTILPDLVREKISLSRQNHGKDTTFEIEVCGLCTDICVISNALLLRAEFPDIEITVDAFCTAGTSFSAKQAAITAMESCQINVTNNEFFEGPMFVPM